MNHEQWPLPVLEAELSRWKHGTDAFRSVKGMRVSSPIRPDASRMRCSTQMVGDV